LCWILHNESQGRGYNPRMLREAFEIRHGENGRYFLRVEQTIEKTQWRDAGDVEITLKGTDESENYFTESMTLKREDVQKLIGALCKTLEP
jgi:hypothetical protein